MKRRQFLKLSSFITVSVATSGLMGCQGPRLASGPGWKFPQSVASGDPRSDSITLWTRVVPTSADDVSSAIAAEDVSILLTVTAADNSALLGTAAPLRGRPVVHDQVPAYADFDNTVRNRVKGLQPATTYYYQFMAGSVRSKVGRFRTAPAANAAVSSLQFATLSCQDWTVNHWAAYEALAGENLDFFLHLGDYIYETVGASFETGRAEAVHAPLSLPSATPLPDGGSGTCATTIADYRYLYKTYRSDPRIQAVHERFAMIAVWDDHEFSDDCWADAETYDDGVFDPVTGAADNSHQPIRRRGANQAWFEFMPADISLDSEAGGFETVRLYRDFHFGSLAQLVMTDERLYRSDHVIAEAAPNPLTGQAVGDIGARYMVAQDLFEQVQAQKISAAGALGRDPLALTTVLGRSQRDWWKERMQSSSATWKLWGNEVSLLRMGVDGTDAIATLLALNSMATLANNIGTAAAPTGGNIPAAAAIVAAATAGASMPAAGAGATAIATSDAIGGTANDDVAAALGAGLTLPQATIAVTAFLAAKAASAGGATAQITAAAQAIAFRFIKPDVQANKANSVFVIAAGLQAALAPFFRKFLLNCDQWDGYDAERKDLMGFLKTQNIRNVVALTGDIHAFFAGTVNDDFDAPGGGRPVMVDLVTAGISSDSYFKFLADAVGGLSASLVPLVYFPLDIPVPALGTTLHLRFNLLDYTMGRAAPANAAELADQVRVQVRGALAAAGLPEAQLDGVSALVLAGLQADPGFNTNLLGLAQALASLDSNPWIRHVNSDAQGYTVVTVTPDRLTAQFKQVNRLVGSAAPGIHPVTRVATATVADGTAAVTMS